VIQSCGIYCIHNAARSPLLEALLTVHYPGITFFSGGVVAEEGNTLPKNSQDFAKVLGLESLKETSENVIAHKDFLESADLILGADGVITSVLQKLYPNKDVLSVEAHAKSMGVRLIDPINTSGYEFNYQVGKFLYCGLSLFRSVFDVPTRYPVTALIANQANIRDEAEKLYREQSSGEILPLLIDCDFKFAAKSTDMDFIPTEKQLPTDAKKLVEMSPSDLDSVMATRQSHEMPAWESFAASKEWSDWLRTVAAIRPVTLLSTPVDIIDGHKHNSFTEALPAEKLVYRARASA